MININLLNIKNIDEMLEFIKQNERYRQLIKIQLNVSDIEQAKTIKIELNFQKFQVQMRDYNRSILEIKNLQTKGSFIFAKFFCSQPQIRTREYYNVEITVHKIEINFRLCMACGVNEVVSRIQKIF